MTERADRVVVIGGGIAGVSTCASLRQLGHRGPVTVVDAGDQLHDRPPLSKDYLAGRTDEDGVRIYPPSWFIEHDIDVRTGVQVLDLDPVTGRVALADGSQLVGETVVLATGAAARPLPVAGGERALTLRSLPDARRLRSRLGPGVRLVVCGAGLVGAEVASTASALGVEVTLVDPDPAPLAALLGQEVAAALHSDHARHGVRAVTAAVESLVAQGDATEVRLEDGQRLLADLVVAAIGPRVVDELARQAGIEVADDAAGGVLVDPRQRTSAPSVLAVGDGTRRRGTTTPAASAGHWDAARLDGLAAAAVLLDEPVPTRGAPWFWSDRHGRHIEVVGEPTAAATRLARGVPGPGPFVVVGWDDGVLTGAVTVDDTRTARAVRRLVDRRVVVDAGELASLLTDPTGDVRSLLRRG